MRIHTAIGIIALLSLTGCASTVPPTLFLPAADDVVSYFVNGMPLAAFDNNSISMLMSLETTELAGTKYMRMWFLLRNKDNATFLLDPGSSFVLYMGGYGDLLPEKPSTILASIENEKAASLILQAVGGALQSMATRDTKITSSTGETLRVHDVDTKREVVKDKNAARMEATNYWYDAFKNSVSSGILRKNTMFPNQSVNGYIYFELPKERDWTGRTYTISPIDREFALTIKMPSAQKVIQFKPIVGE